MTLVTSVIGFCKTLGFLQSIRLVVQGWGIWKTYENGKNWFLPGKMRKTAFSKIHVKLLANKWWNVLIRDWKRNLRSLCILWERKMYTEGTQISFPVSGFDCLGLLGKASEMKFFNPLLLSEKQTRYKMEVG